MSGDLLASMFYWTIYKRGDTEGNTLMGRSITKLSYMNNIHTGKMVSWILCVPFLMTIHSTTNAMPKCCYDSNLGLTLF